MRDFFQYINDGAPYTLRDVDIVNAFQCIDVVRFLPVAPLNYSLFVFGRVAGSISRRNDVTAKSWANGDIGPQFFYFQCVTLHISRLSVTLIYKTALARHKLIPILRVFRGRWSYIEKFIR